ncbi:MAG: mannitol dehydrogenase family protein [Actinomycetota bacterium]|nr:mannitol dehydrogenase family protein [Actinomycetota bacterium]
MTKSRPRLSRAEVGRPVAPVRIVHLGVGNFFRAHQAWYTEHASDASEWGIAAFTGRTASASRLLQAQDGLYTLAVRGPSGTELELIGSLSAVHSGEDAEALRGYLASPQVAVVTLTVTEAGYRRSDAGGLDLTADDVVHDIAVLSGRREGVPVTAPGRLVDGLAARRAAKAGPLAIVPCDNIPDNGAMTGVVVRELAAAADPTLASWVDANVSFVTTMVDRITPRATGVDLDEVRERTGLDDRAVVVTEPFSEWVLSGEFPSGRPAWDTAGARFVNDIRPFETRKLWLLNGAHSLMAYAASALGHETVADAIADPEVFAWVEEWWSDASRHLTLPPDEVDAYRHALFERFLNPQIRHLLAQIAADGSQKVPIRVLPVLRAARADGLLPSGATRAIAGWVVHLRGHGAAVSDVGADQLVPLVTGTRAESVAAVLGWLGVDDIEVTAMVECQVDDLESR